MAIVITKQGKQYLAEVTQPHGDAEWSTMRPLSADDLINALRTLGCHQTDIGDAFYVADPVWLDAKDSADGPG